MNKTICGVDVSKEWLDASVAPSGAAGRFGNDATGIAELEAFCRSHDVELVVMEASGGFEQLAFLLLWEAGVPCAIVNARNVRQFAEAMGFLEKTDTIDAAVIAHYGQVRRVQPTPLPSAAQQRLKALVSRLSQVTGDLVIQKQRRSAATDAETVASLDEVVALLKRQQRRLEGEIASLIDDDPLWACLDKAFRSLKGVADRTVARLMAALLRMPGIDRVVAITVIAEIGIDVSMFPTAAHLAAWAGVCPGNHQSAGKSKPTKARKGNRHLKTALCNTAVSASKKTGSYYKAKYHKLKARRGGGKAALAPGFPIRSSGQRIFAAESWR